MPSRDIQIPLQPNIVQELAVQRSGSPTFYPWDQVAGQFGIETGQVFIEDFDLGVVKTLGASIDPNSSADEASFVLPVPGLKEDGQRVDTQGNILVPVTFAHPESYMNIWTLPGIFIRREAIEPDLLRYSQELEGFRVPAPQAVTTEIDGSVGPNEVLSRVRAEAYNFVYVVDMVARYRTDANALLRTVLPRFKQHKAILVRDSKGDLNEYSSFLESVDQIDEILGVTLKHHGYALTLRVVGELDLSENDLRKTVSQVDLEVVTKKVTDVAAVETTIDGLPLKKGPSAVLGKICNHIRPK